MSVIQILYHQCELSTKSLPDLCEDVSLCLSLPLILYWYLGPSFQITCAQKITCTSSKTLIFVLENDSNQHLSNMHQLELGTEDGKIGVKVAP